MKKQQSAAAYEMAAVIEWARSVKKRGQNGPIAVYHATKIRQSFLVRLRYRVSEAVPSIQRTNEPKELTNVDLN
jgi:hypothetical protein